LAGCFARISSPTNSDDCNPLYTDEGLTKVTRLEQRNTWETHGEGGGRLQREGVDGRMGEKDGA